jgi:hypothetical protein
MKRGMILLGSLLTLAASMVALGVATWWGSRPCPVDVRLETCYALKPGMSESEVEAVLGGPAGDYRTRKHVGYLFAVSGWLGNCDGITRRWDTDEYAIHVLFSRDGKVGAILGAPGFDTSPTLSDRYPLLKNLQPLISFLEGHSRGRFVTRPRTTLLGPLLVAVISLAKALWTLIPQIRRVGR